MILTNKQEEALKIAVARYRSKEPYTCIAGFAGSGKTTLIKFIIAALNLSPDDVGYAAFTGKAATVLTQKGCANATTAHKLLYHATPTKDGKFVFKPRTELENPYKLIVIDEISMLPKTMWNLLLTHRVHVLALGDPAQLPPVDKDEDNHVLDEPHIFLDEIMRQAQESEIIRLSMHVREGKPFSSFHCEGKQVKIFQASKLDTSICDWADQILCATNAVRTGMNNFVRERKGLGTLPEAGDKIISLKNHWDTYSEMDGWALTNGTIGTINDYTVSTKRLPKFIAGGKDLQYMKTNFTIDTGDRFTSVPIDYQCLLTGNPSLNAKEAYMMNKNQALPDAPYEFAYAYAITVWKAQGSEWNKVLLLEEKFPFDAETHCKYLYTGITRAADKLVVATK